MEFWIKNIGSVGEDPSNERIWQIVPRSFYDMTSNSVSNSESHVSFITFDELQLYKLRNYDIIKFGRIKFRIKELVCG